MEQEQHQTEIRDLQDQLSEMHDELDNAKHADEREKEVLLEVSYKLLEELHESRSKDTDRRNTYLNFSHSINPKQCTILR